MVRYVALLRGIAPSGRNMTNDKLRGVCKRLGLEAVTSVLASGNILFRSAETDVPALEQRNEDALAADLGVRSRVVVRSLPELRALVDSDPFDGLTHGPATYLTVTFVQDARAVSAADVAPPPPTPPLVTMVRYDPAARAVLAVSDNRGPAGASPLMLSLERVYGTDVTTRSWLTVLRVVRALER
jgi:uncharacterized protein (DUF1697 family)